MRLLKLGLISLIVIAVIVYLLSLLIPSHVRISRAVNIATVRDSVLGSLSDMRQWKKWNEMTNNSALTDRRYSEQTFSSAELSVQIQSVSADSVITSWKYKNSVPVHSGFNLVQSLTDTTVVQWYFDFHLKWYPWEKFGSIIFDQQLGPGMEKSLVQLKSTVEASR
jgi:hypothetical protein